MVSTKMIELDHTEALEIVYNFFKIYEEHFNAGTIPSNAEWKKYLSPNFILKSNGVVKCNNMLDYIKRYKLFQEYYVKFKFSDPIEKPVISNNHLTIYYTIDMLTHEGTISQVYVMALGNIEEGKIASWIQVAHEKGSSDWDE